MTNESQLDRIVVMTGGTAGLGAHALDQLAGRSHTRVLVGARGSDRVVPPGVQVVPLDLASLESVWKFVDAVTAELGDGRIDSLVLNAGMQTSSNEGRSTDGFETTFAVNHLAHYLLVRLLTPWMAEGGRVVITTSETHDPAVTPIAPKTFEPQAWAQPTESGFGSGIRAYAASKLCNLMTALTLTEVATIVERKVSVVAFSPGLTGGTSLGRDSSRLMRAVVTFLMHTVFRLVGLFKPEYVIGSARRSGEALAEVALGELTPPPGRIYITLVKGQPAFPEPSKLASDPIARAELWRESAAMVGFG